MRTIVVRFGVPVGVIAPSEDGCVAKLAEGHVRLGADGGIVTCERPASAEAGGSEPFQFSELGSTQRLAWPGGGCTVRQRSRVVYFRSRYAAIVDLTSITVIDAAANRQARIELAVHAPWAACIAHAGRLWIGGERRVSIVELAALEAVVAGTERELVVAVRTVYPLRDEGAATEARVAWVFENGDALVNIGTKQLRVNGHDGFAKGMTITMRDELVPGTFAIAELPDGARVTLAHVDERVEMRVRVVRGKTRDPAATGAAVVETDARLAPLLAEYARDPDNAENRLVLVDLLQELGVPVIVDAAARGKRREALGPLAHYLEDVTYEHGLPRAATLVRRPPLDGAMLAQAAGDVRLGLVSTLRIGRGPRAVYAALVGSPRAVGLRRIDAVDREVAAAVIEAGHTHLAHLSDVRFTQAALVKLLAHETFDRVVEIETVVQSQHVAGLLARVEADEHGVFARAPRRLVVHERWGHHTALLGPVLARFPALPVAELRIDGVTVRRDAGGIVARVASMAVPISYWLEPLAQALPQLAAIELEDRQALLAVEDRFPNTAIR